MYSWSNANNLKFTFYENGKRITIFDVCARVSDYSDGKVRLDDVHTTNVDINRDYNLFDYNCVQVSMQTLLKGKFYSYYEHRRNILNENKNRFIPNYVYEKLKSN